MARPKKSGDAFSYNDLAVVAGISGRAVRQVAEAGLLPQGDGIRTLKRIAVIGAIVAAGVPLMAAAQVAEALNLEFNQADGETPSGLDNLYRELPPHEIRLLSDHNDYWLHRALCRYPEIYARGRSMRGDAVLEIADREFVFVRVKGLSVSIHNPFVPGGLSKTPPPEGRIEDWRRGGNPVFVAFVEDVVPFDDDGKPTAEAIALDSKMRVAYENAVGLIAVNLSLAIRNGLDQLADHRSGQKKNCEMTIRHHPTAIPAAARPGRAYQAILPGRGVAPPHRSDAGAFHRGKVRKAALHFVPPSR